MSDKANPWIPIVKYDGYFVNRLGEVRSTKLSKDILLKPMVTKLGYTCVDLFIDNKKSRKLIHTLVADAFLSDRSGLEVDHIDGDKSNNNLDNLRLLTRTENLRSHWTVKDGASSKYRGVSWHKKKKKWSSSIRISGKLKYLGDFYGERAAALVYDIAATRHGFNKEALNYG